jgi:BirA family biotin operon repressor/biotin-[acetyl-CoA-carboxylase] ligase
MHLICDSPEFARQLLPEETFDRLSGEPLTDPTLRVLENEFLGQGADTLSTVLPSEAWRCLVLTRYASRSQYDRMIGLARSGSPLPDRTLCLAGAGDGFHGFKGRPWSAAPGNIHLTVHLAPQRPIERAQVAFTVLAAISIVDALDRIPELRDRVTIKWVNDVLVDDAKVAGLLAYTLSQGSTVSSAILGIGLNVETAPEVHRTDFVPAVASLRQLAPGAPGVTQGEVFATLMESLDSNYRVLLDQGYAPLFARYRDRSCIEGAQVAICTEESDGEPEALRKGRVTALGAGLELYLDDSAEPVTRGRVMLLDKPPRPASTPDPAASERSRGTR